MARYLGELWGLDVHIGRLLSAIDDAGLRNSTVVLFSSDHGPEQSREAELGSTGLCRGGKQDVLEGGLRLPYVVRWPGRVPAGHVDAESLIGNVDFFATVAALARVPTSSIPATDGVSVAEQWLGRPGPRRGGAVWAWPRETGASDRKDSREQAIRAGGSLKVFVQYQHQPDDVARGECRVKVRALYDVVRDPGETRNLVNRSRLLEPLLAKIHLENGRAPRWSNGSEAHAGCVVVRRAETREQGHREVR